VVLDPPAVEERQPHEFVEHRWFAPALQALRERRLSTVTLFIESGGSTSSFELGRGDLWKFWRRLPALVE
jgi:hypothetical protein